MVTEPQGGTIIPTAEDLRTMVNDKNNGRRKELKEAASFVLDSMGKFICHNMDEIVESEEGVEYTLSMNDIKTMCDAKSKALLVPNTPEEFDVFINIITNTLSDNGYRTSITAVSPPGDSVAILISANPKPSD